MVPENIGITGDGGGSYNASVETEELHGQQGENTAKEKVNIEENWLVKVVASQAGDN
jgi:hypothetical protein